jgi:DNA-binding MarR family transcriptional regulator
VQQDDGGAVARPLDVQLAISDGDPELGQQHDNQGVILGDVSATPLPPDELGRRLPDVFAVLGPLYRRVSRVVEDAEHIEGASIGVRAVLERLQLAGPEPVPAIAAALVLSRQFVQRNVDAAAARSWVRSAPNPAHRRSVLIELTPEGERIIAAIIAREQAVLSTVGGDLTAGDIDACIKVLRHLYETILDQ